MPVDYQDFKNEQDEMAHMISDNKIAELSSFNNSALKEILIELDTGALDMEAMGFTNADLENLMTQFHVEDEERDSEKTCPECRRRL